MLQHLLSQNSGSPSQRYGLERSRKFSSKACGRTAQNQTSGLSLKTIVSVLVALLISVASYASHYKGGQITYENLGGGTYKVTVKSYWRSTLPGSVAPSYSG